MSAILSACSPPSSCKGFVANAESIVIGRILTIKFRYHGQVSLAKGPISVSKRTNPGYWFEAMPALKTSDKNSTRCSIVDSAANFLSSFRSSA